MNPFICGTMAHNAWESRTGDSNCESDNRKKEPRRIRHHKPISSEGLSDMFKIPKEIKQQIGLMPKGWKEEQLLNRCCV